ncbi:MAG TPA: DUF4440 domain-containing protein [Candidatus Udaeobacter sp.]|nr:DUF4440 domain-containing protein [Candidatus Udaeobacter sp.]
MKNLFICTVSALLATIAVSVAATGDKEAIISKEKAAWQAFKDKKTDDFKKLVSSDLVAVYADGIYNMQKELDAMEKTDVKSFDLSDFNVSFPDRNTAIVAYKARMNAMLQGTDISGNYNVGSVWHMVNGQWIAIFHADAKVAPPPPTSPAG